MEIKEEYYIDRLTENSVSVAKQDFLENESGRQKLGELHRRAYYNSESGREELKREVPEPYSSAVFAVWGDKPTVIEDGGGDE